MEPPAPGATQRPRTPMRYGSVAPHARKRPTGLDWVQKFAVGTAAGHFLIVLAASTGAFFVEALLFTFWLYNDALWMIGMLLVTEAVLVKLASQKQRSPYHFPMGLCSAFSCALGALAGTWIYDSYGYFALIYSRSRTYENIVPLEKAAAVADAGGLVFADEAHVDVSMSAGYAASDGHVYCAAPVRGMDNSTDVEFWAVGKDCCSSLGDFTCDSAGDSNAHGARIVLSDGGIFRRSSAYQYQRRAAEEQVLKARADLAEQVRKEKEAEFERKRREDEHEMEKRKDIIRQIRALEKVPVERFKVFDPAEQPCQGLLEEMSMAELRDRLKITEARHAKELEEKRERQLEKKLEKQQELMEKAETLAKIRERSKEEQQQKHAAVRRQKEETEMAQKAYREKCITEVADKIQQKKQQKHQEEMRLKKELKELSAKRQFLQANADNVEAKAHAEQHRGLEREARDRQRNLLVDQAKGNAIKNKDATVLRENRQSDKDRYKAMQEEVNERLKLAKDASSKLKDDILRANVSARNSQKTIERRLAAEVGHSSNRYLQRVAQRMSVSA